MYDYEIFLTDGSIYSTQNSPITDFEEFKQDLCDILSEHAQDIEQMNLSIFDVTIYAEPIREPMTEDIESHVSVFIHEGHGMQISVAKYRESIFDTVHNLEQYLDYGFLSKNM